jgi:hypothetical protein
VTSALSARGPPDLQPPRRPDVKKTKTLKTLGPAALASAQGADHGVLRPALDDDELARVGGARGARLCGGTNTCLALHEA